MNMLNSFIIEGVVMEDSSYDGNSYGTSVCEFRIKQTAEYKKNDKTVKKKEENIFPVNVFGKSANFAASKAVKGRMVRIVGRIRVVNNKEWFVVAEHIQYMPLNTNE